jgi:uncharacterized protein
MKKWAVAIIAVLGCTASAAAERGAGPTGAWAGSARFTAGGAGPEPFALSLEIRGRRAIVSMASGYPARTELPARVVGRRVRLRLPGRPWPLLLDGRIKGRRMIGTLRQGPLRGTFRLRRSGPLEGGTLGLYRFGDGRILAATQAFGPRLGVLLNDDEVRGLYPTGRGRYAVGAGLLTRNPSVGLARFSAAAVDWLGTRAERIRLRQEAVWIRSGRTLLGCTLTIPPATGRTGAIAFAHGAGASRRSWNSTLAVHFLAAGLATLSCDKRGIAQSGGDYPGEAAVPPNIDQYARDVEAQARFLARQPEIDAARVGVAGGSQAGWIMPRAARREPAIRFMVGFVAPTLTVDQTNFWARLTNHGAEPPTSSDEELENETRASPESGFDPLPDIRSLRIPAIWLLGGKDRTVPSRLCVERLEPIAREPGRDFAYSVFPGGTHGLILTENGLQDEAARSNRLVAGLHSTIRAWLVARGFTGAAAPRSRRG